MLNYCILERLISIHFHRSRWSYSQRLKNIYRATSVVLPVQHGKILNSLQLRLHLYIFRCRYCVCRAISLSAVANSMKSQCPVLSHLNCQQMKALNLHLKRDSAFKSKYWIWTRWNPGFNEITLPILFQLIKLSMWLLYKNIKIVNVCCLGKLAWKLQEMWHFVK